MIKYQHFREIMEDTCSTLKLYKPEFILALSMIIGHESKGGYYLRQHPVGEGLGMIQMERKTHDSIWEHCDNIQLYAKRLGVTRNVNKLKYDLQYNIFMARMYFIMDTNPFPKTEQGMAEYLKSYWNSEKGAATPAKYIADYRNWIDD